MDRCSPKDTCSLFGDNVIRRFLLSDRIGLVLCRGCILCLTVRSLYLVQYDEEVNFTREPWVNFILGLRVRIGCCKIC